MVNPIQIYNKVRLKNDRLALTSRGPIIRKNFFGLTGKVRFAMFRIALKTDS
jgi:hypothetical protein